MSNRLSINDVSENVEEFLFFFIVLKCETNKKIKSFFKVFLFVSELFLPTTYYFSQDTEFIRNSVLKTLNTKILWNNVCMNSNATTDAKLLLWSYGRPSQSLRQTQKCKKKKTILDKVGFLEELLKDEENKTNLISSNNAYIYTHTQKLTVTRYPENLDKNSPKQYDL